MKIAGLFLFIPLLAQGAPWQSLDGVSLSQAIDIALEHNYDVGLARLAVDGAVAATISASAPRNPTLTLQTANINPVQGIGAGSLRDKAIDTTVRIDQLIERGGKRALRAESATHLENAARADMSEAQRQLQLRVAQSYYDVLAAQEKLLGAQETIALFERTAAAARTRKGAGDIAGADAGRIEVDALRAQNEARRAEADLAKARLALAALLGVPPTAGTLRATDPWPELMAVAFRPALDARIELRPDVKAAQERVDAAEAGRRLARAARTRDITVGVQYEHWPQSATNTQGTGNSYGISVQVPLFVRYRFEGEIRAASTALDSARQNLEKVRAAARIDLQQALQELRSAADRVQRFQNSLLPAARKSAEAAEFAFRNGAIDVMDVLDARRTYRATQLDSVTARADYAKALAAWRATTLEET